MPRRSCESLPVSIRRQRITRLASGAPRQSGVGCSRETKSSRTPLSDCGRSSFSQCPNGDRGERLRDVSAKELEEAIQQHEEDAGAEAEREAVELDLAQQLFGLANHTHGCAQGEHGEQHRGCGRGEARGETAASTGLVQDQCPGEGDGGRHRPGGESAQVARIPRCQEPGACGS